MLAEELIELHRSPREVAPFSERYPGLSTADGYRAARALHEHRLGQGWGARFSLKQISGSMRGCTSPVSATSQD